MIIRFVSIEWLRKADWQFTMVSAAYNLKRFIGQLFPAQAQAVIWRE